MKNGVTQLMQRALQAATVVVVACGAGVYSTPALAQSSLEEIVVTAQRREQSIQDIPYNISAFSSDYLESARAFNIGDVSRLVAGLNFKDQGESLRSSRNTFILRGINANDSRLIFGTDVSSGAVSMYYGDTPLFFPLVMKDIERVEVLRGPQGTLYGSGSLGGTIRFIPKEADFDEFSFETNVHVDTMSESDDLSYGGDVMFNIPLIDDSLALRLVGSVEDLAGFVDGIGLVEFGANGQPVPSVAGDLASGYVLAPEEDTNSSQSVMFRASLNWAPTDNVDVQVAYLTQKSEVDDFSGVNPGFDGGLVDASLAQFPGSFYANANACNGGAAFQADFFTPNLPCLGAGGNTLYANSGVVVPDAGDYEHTMFLKSSGESSADIFSADLNIELGFATLSSATSYSEVSYENTPDFTGFDLPVRVPGGSSVATFNSFYPRAAGVTSSFDETERFTQEIRLTSSGDNKIDYVVGAYFEDRKSVGVTETRQPGLSEFDTTVNVANLGFERGKNNANLPDITFAEDREFNFEDVAVFGGLFCSSPEQPRFFEGGTTVNDAKREFEDQIFKINTSYDINDDMMAYFTWSEGFRHGGANALPTAGRQASLPELMQFQPDSTTNWEVGLKGSISENLNYSIAAFLVEWSDFQFESLVTNGFKVVLNGEEAETSGIELELNGRLGENLTYNFGYSYVNAEVSKDFVISDYLAGTTGNFFIPPGTTAPLITVLDGDPLPSVPDTSVTLSLDYLQPIGSEDWTLNFHLDGRYASDSVSTFSDDVNFGRDFFKIDSYSVYNAAITMESGKNWNLSLFGRNLGNEQNLSAGNTAAAAGGLHQYFFTLRPRTIGLSFNYRTN
jgi:outer membrane receptor protein involved in Fe transport